MVVVEVEKVLLLFGQHLAVEIEKHTHFQWALFHRYLPPDM